MEKCEFEEKEYEQPLNNQLLQGNNHLWTPGQVFEEHFGIDAALEVHNPTFWGVLGYSGPLSGIVLEDYNWGYIWRRTNNKRNLPDYRLNAFIQTKRPEYLYGKSNAYSKLGIKGSYYRFIITGHQQIALERVSSRLGNKALVVYACPAFHTHQELFQNTRMNSLVAKSTFVKIRNMSGHEKWVYDQPGTMGLACSEVQL